jgi:hypothetical protein
VSFVTLQQNEKIVQLHLTEYGTPETHEYIVISRMRGLFWSLLAILRTEFGCKRETENQKIKKFDYGTNQEQNFPVTESLSSVKEPYQ